MAGIRGRQNSSVWQTCQGYYLPVLSWSSLTIYIFWSFTKKICLKKGEVWRKKVISTKLLSRLSQKVCRLLFSSVLLRKLPIICVTMRVSSSWPGCHGYLSCCLAAPSFWPGSSPFTYLLARGLIKDQSYVMFSSSWSFFPIVCLSHPHLYSQPSFFYYNDSNNFVHEFFVFLASSSARYLFWDKFIYIRNKIIINCTHYMPSHSLRAATTVTVIWKSAQPTD